MSQPAPRAQSHRLDMIFDGAAIKITLMGEQTGLDAAFVRQKMARLLLEHDHRRVLADLRQASYRHEALPSVRERVLGLFSVFPTSRIAVWHRNDDAFVLSALLEALCDAGHLAVGVLSLEEARSFLCDARGQSDALYI